MMEFEESPSIRLASRPSCESERTSSWLRGRSFELPPRQLTGDLATEVHPVVWLMELTPPLIATLSLALALADALFILEQRLVYSITLFAL